MKLSNELVYLLRPELQQLMQALLVRCGTSKQIGKVLKLSTRDVQQIIKLCDLTSFNTPFKIIYNDNEVPKIEYKTLRNLNL